MWISIGTRLILVFILMACMVQLSFFFPEHVHMVGVFGATIACLLIL